MTKTEYIFNEAHNLAIDMLKAKLKDNKLIPQISEGEIMDKKYKSGIYKGIQIAIQVIERLKTEE